MTTRYALTPVIAKLLDFITAELATGRAPTLDEMMLHLGQKSKSGVHRILIALEQRGHIRRLPKRERAIALAPPEPSDAEVDAAIGAYRRATLGPSAPPLRMMVVGDLMDMRKGMRAALDAASARQAGSRR